MMYGLCRKCGKPAIGSYYGGSPGLCYDHFQESRGKSKTKNEQDDQDQIIQKAKELAERTGITLLEAIAIIKK
jgi:hypothetical protein